jgi:paraquat-inducible protein B
LDNSVLKTQKSKQITRISVAILVTIGVWLSAGSQSLANDYLDELASEAKSTASVSKKNQLSSSEKKQFEEMEALLKTEKPSTYKYYVKLDKKKKERAFKAYAKDSSDSEERLHHLQKTVMDLYFAQ